MPCRDVLIGQPGCNVKHDDGALTMNAAEENSQAHVSDNACHLKLIDPEQR